MAESAVSAVLGSAGNLAVQETIFLCGVTLQVGLLKDELMRIQAYLKDADNKWRLGNARVAILVTQIRAAAYEAQNVIEEADYMEKRNRIKKGFIGAISRYARLPTDLITLHKIGADIQRVRRKLSEIFVSAENLKIDLDNTGVVDYEFPQDNGLMNQNSEDDVVMVGFEDEHKEIVDKLVSGDNMLTAVSIVAMGGAGKTTLARKVYTSSTVRKHFEAIAWVTVSQKFKGIDLLNNIMKQIIGTTDESSDIDVTQEYEVGKKIHDFLLHKRYFVVLDDVWETDTWEQISRMVNVFPDATTGSRILLTTRKKDVANHIQMQTHVHVLKHLDDEKSWELFSSRALPSYKRSSICDVKEVEELGRKLAKKCNGLPLALAVLGAYLSKNLNSEAWSDMLLDWSSTKNGQMMRAIIARSYKDLPSHYFRSCFLYFAAFCEDSEIDVSDLIEIWIAESLIPHMLKHTPEQTARKYVTELAQRSLVQVVSRSRAHGWIETIRIHDILRDWCVEEARQDGFLNAIDNTTRVGASSSDTMISYRYSFQNITGQILQATPNAQTLVGFRLSSVSLPKLRFLRVIHIENSDLKDFCAIDGFIHLRYLRLRACRHVALPTSIGKLLNLENLDLRNTYLKEAVPMSLWHISTLRHVYLSNVFPPPSNVQQKELMTLWLDLGSIGTKYFGNGMVNFVGQMTQLTTLFLCMSLVPAEMINIFVNMPRLVDIYLTRFSVLGKLPESHHFPQSLRRLHLSADVINQDPMPILEKLPSLVVLILRGYEGRTMSCSAQGFPRLQELKLRSFSMEEWRMELGTMPKLSHLELWWCQKISELPEGLLHLSSLSVLKLYDASLISEDDNTLKELRRKACEVGRC
ncbi:hypothetical protein CFC21_105709 [Triticum aestivum]|uniref:NB-ARC domain-containing protein n=3 Tax=Triticum aestivum TaxID=4565 RepID=A0A3B6SPH5_WHEAT|nr:putative disease resistance protein At1g50180 isoform X1 [Triticum aestivum]XP_044435425.1 putative disease resistance protein At1g50180 isoform X1 [Triticum aestivum]XP_044435426.1 putative disease resistance protein At1g50180 isoform X1 [Triticum aestivum]KAF7104841.1 hypothetical protein CFC21_105709 [Triticum aestivum]